MAIDWSSAPDVVVPRIIHACPGCGSREYLTLRSMGDIGDGVRQRRCVCRNCSSPFKISEDPAIGWQDD